MAAVFGPVPSRRLGRSLGIDVIPSKTCSFDCVYCESGRTTHLTIKRRSFIPPEKVIEDVERYLLKYPQGADVLTFSGAGEPTLYKPLGELVSYIKRRYASLPLIVLTNASLLWDPEVRQDLMAVDRVVPSLDAASHDAFLAINRPHPELDLEMILEGLQAFRKDYRGDLCLEVMLVEGLNNSSDQLKKIRDLADRIDPDRIELNTVVRPPADMGTLGLSQPSMERALAFFPKNKTQIIGAFNASDTPGESLDLDSRILNLVSRRPCSAAEMSASLGVTWKAMTMALQRLHGKNLLTRYTFNGIEYICASLPESADSPKSDFASSAHVPK